jgi:Fur family ferric uptake transcriptional regulator
MGRIFHRDDDCTGARDGLWLQVMHHHHGDEPSPEAQLATALDKLRENGQRVTGPRKAILTILIAEHGPFSAEDLHRKLPAGECDLVTVYRSLTAMEDLDVVRRCDFGDGTYRYEINLADHHHHHIICRTCREVQVMDICVADPLERMARQLGYENVTHTLEIFGVCPKCRAKKRAAE